MTRRSYAARRRILGVRAIGLVSAKRLALSVAGGIALALLVQLLAAR